MTQQHSITMPPELVKELWDKFRKTPINSVDEAIAWEQAIAQAVQWATDQANANIERKLQEAADQELEACLNCVNKWGSSNNSFADALRAARRPKPPSLKEEALQKSTSMMINCHWDGPPPSPHASVSDWFEQEGSKGVLYGLRISSLPSLGGNRSPKPLSLKEKAFAALGPEPLPETGPTGDTILNKGKIERHRIIHRALKALPDD